MEVDDDEMVVVIVSGETEELYSDVQADITDDPEDTGALGVEELIATATKHGEVLPIEFQVKDETNQYLKEELLEDSLDTGALGVEELYETESQHGEDVPIEFEVKDESNEYLNEEFSGDSSDESADDTDSIQQEHQVTVRRRMLKPHQRRSYVKELRQKYPELRADVNLLIERLCEDMRSLKPPPPPQDYFVMDGIMFKCVECEALCKSMAVAARHYQDIHGPRYLKCFACGVDFKKIAHLYKHEKLCHAPDSTIVLKARARTIGRNSKGRPFQPKKKPIKAASKTPSKQYKCQLCPAAFSYTSTLKSHMYIHSGTRPYKCDQCPAAYTSQSSLCYHKQTHKAVEYICDHCKRSFRMKPVLVAHMATHEPQRKFECTVCGRRYAKNVALKLHINKKHLNLPLPCACQFCPKRYREMSVLKQHMEKAHGMSLMTRNMFYKKLPTLTETEFNEAIFAYKCDVIDETGDTLQQTKDCTLEKNVDQDLELNNKLLKTKEHKAVKQKDVDENDVKVIIVKHDGIVSSSNVMLK